MLYPTTPMQSLPPLGLSIFNEIFQQNGWDVKVFNTSTYGKGILNSTKNLKLAELGGNRKDIVDVSEAFEDDPADIIPDFIATVEDYQPDYMIVSVVDSTWALTVDMLEAVKKFDIPTLVGGVFAITRPDLVIQNENVDAVCLHEGEHVIENLAKKDTLNLQGVWYKDSSGTIIKNSPETLCDFGKITPNFDFFNMDHGLRNMGGRVFNKVLSLETMRGCPYNCSYCCSPTVRDTAEEYNMGRYLRKKSPEVVDRDLAHYHNLYDIDIMVFQDDSFLARSEKEVVELCKVLEKYKTPFWFNTRIEDCTPAKLEAIKQAGGYRISFGIESGNEDYRMNVLGRRVTNSTYQKYFNYINDSNIAYSFNIIIGFPLETREMVLDTARLVHSARGYDSVSTFIFEPFHGTRSRQLAIDHGFLDPNYIAGNVSDGSLLSGWALSMPKPYLQHDDVIRLQRCFVLYAYYPESMWDQVFAAETDDVLYKELMDRYSEEFFTPYQLGGKDRIKQLKW